jgi:hypothetical protein
VSKKISPLHFGQAKISKSSLLSAIFILLQSKKLGLKVKATMPVSSKGLGLPTFLVVEARIETRLSILVIRASFRTSFLLRYQHRHP